MNDPRLQELPQNASAKDRAAIFAADLAYGCDIQEWAGEFIAVQGFWYFDNMINDHESMSDRLKNYLARKWNNNPPTSEMLVSFGFLTRVPGRKNIFQLTEKAFNSVKSDEKTSLVFISYRGSESSALALLIEARLQLAGVSEVFIDKNMQGGEIWKSRLENDIKKCKYFVCLIAPTTLESEMVQNEIRWAREYGKIIIPICHNGQTLRNATQLMEVLKDSNGREIKAEPKNVTAREYDELVQFVVNSILANIHATT